MLETVILIRNIFYKCFLTGFLFLIFSTLFWTFNKDFSVDISTTLFNVEKHEIILLMVYFISWIKVILFYFFLIPALALHWTANTMKKSS